MAENVQPQETHQTKELDAAPIIAEPIENSGHSVGISSSTWFTPFLLVGIGLFLYSVRHILPPFVVAAVLAFIFSPLVGWIEGRARIPRLVAVVLFYLAVLGPVGLFIWILEPALIRETRELIVNTPDIIRNLLFQLFGAERVDILGQRVDAESATRYLFGSLRESFGTPAGAIRVVASLVETVLHAFLTLVLLFYFLMDRGYFARTALRLIPAEHRNEWQKVGGDIHSALSRYVRGLLFLVALMSCVTWIGLTFLFHLPYALPIAIATGFLEIIPFLGPVTAACIAMVVGLFHGDLQLVLGIALFYLVVRQLEDQLVMPLVIGHAVEIHPAIAIFAVLAGGAIAGILGALLGIPTAAAVKIAFDRWRPA